MEPTEVQELKQVIQELTEINQKLVKGTPLWKSFLTGAVGAIGATVGAAVIITLLATILNALSGVNIFKPAIQSILPYVQQKKATVQPAQVNDSVDALPSPTYESPSPDVSATPSI